MKIKIGTRKSKLAVAQAHIVMNEIQSEFPDIDIEIVHISTKGDRINNMPLSKIGGKGIFVSEIEQAILRNEIDIAVHSAKDLPVKLAANLEISSVIKRGNSCDVLVTAAGNHIRNENDFIVGTGSVRRRLSMKSLYPNVSFEEIRGNVDTRLKKLENGEYDGIILAAAGLERLDIIESSEYNFQQFDSSIFLPAPCQGIIAIESRINDFVTPTLNKISDSNTFFCFETERYVLELLNADCSMPVGALAEIKDKNISLTVTKNEGNIVSETSEISKRFELAKELISQL